MKTINEELKKIGFPDDLLKVMSNSEYLEEYEIEINDFHFQDYENRIVSSIDVSINEEIGIN
ncbi:MAG: hypothetical protein R3Y59_01275 [bacterium]